MKHDSIPVTTQLQGHLAIQAKCFHPSGTFMEFKKGEIEQSIPHRFEKIVAAYPGRVAVKANYCTLTYDGLNTAANQIARAVLRERGKREEPIALLFEQGAEAISAMLGVLKAGKAYVSLDPSLPRARANYILEDSGTGLIVTNTENFSLASELAKNQLKLICIEQLDAGLSPENLCRFISPDAPTWILHTSGSTGQPKGVVQTHRNVLQYVMNYTNGFHICFNDRYILLFSSSVNGAAHEIFSALLTGASLYPLNIKERGLACMADWLIENDITIYCSVPTVFRHFANTLTGKEEFPHLRLIKMIGEPVSKREVDLYKKYFSRDCIFINRLGSTETGSIRWYFIDKNTQIADNSVPVGYPVEGNEILLLDDAGKKVGFNQIGEIAVKSRYLAQGYWRKPDRSQAAFRPDPAQRGKRIYLTGDLGRMLPDGCLVHMGRKDFQVKIRGHRIEIAEIEMALLELNNIREVVVVTRENPSAEQRLVAYLVPASHPSPTVTELRNFLSSRLPDYMIPSAWVFLDALPLAPNGKVNRRALPSPSPVRPDLKTPFMAPRTSVEETLAAIWSEILCINPVGIQDNFLDLGGNSLQATRVISGVLKAFQVKLPLRSLFEAPTVADMAETVTRSLREQKNNPLNIANSAYRGDEEELAAKIEQLSDEEVEALLKDMLAEEETSK